MLAELASVVACATSRACESSSSILPSTGVAGAAAADGIDDASSSSRKENRSARNSAQQQATAESKIRRSRDREDGGQTAPFPLYGTEFGTVCGESRGRFAIAAENFSSCAAELSLLLSHGRRHVVPPSRRGDIGGFHGEEPASEEPAVSVIAHAPRVLDALS